MISYAFFVRSTRLFNYIFGLNRHYVTQRFIGVLFGIDVVDLSFT
jgi:hypothetical protein